MIKPIHFFLLIALSGCLAYLAWLLWALAMPGKWRRRVRAIQGNAHAASNDGLNQLKNLVLAVGRWSGETDDGSVRQLLVHAGLRSPSGVLIFMGLRVLLAGGGLLGAWLLVPHSPYRYVWILLAAAAGFYLPNVLLKRKVNERQQALARSLPEALDLMTIAVDAGLGLDAAILRVTQKIGVHAPVLRQELDATWMEVQAGVPRAVALQNLAQRTGVEDINLLVALLNSAEQLGVPISGALHNFSATLRQKRQQRAEEQAAKMPVKLLFPLVFLILPVLLLLILGPSVSQILHALATVNEGGA